MNDTSNSGFNATSGNQRIADDGFSSDEEEIKNQQVFREESKVSQENHSEKIIAEIKQILPPPQQIKSKAYSLLPDKATGWELKQEEPNPIPITFTNKKLDALASLILAEPHEKRKFEVVYLGPRYDNTFYAWRDKPFKFPYAHINLPKHIKYKKRPFLGQNCQVENCLHFDSIFESGNLDLAIKTGEKEYDLFIRVDSNTRGHFQWFNFTVRNFYAGEPYKFNICNLEKAFCLYSRGMKPYIRVMKKSAKADEMWSQGGINVCYLKKQSKAAKHYNMSLSHTKQSVLSFQISVDNDEDIVQIAYCVPYTYSRTLESLEELQEQIQKRSINCKNQSHVLKRTNLCTSLGGLPVPLLTITESNSENISHTQPQTNHQSLSLSNITMSTAGSQKKKKKCILICGRVHPGESNGSFMMEGFLKFLCGNDKMAQYLRRHVIFKIVPMMNPDGVVLGNYRTGLSGRDFNREYRNPDKDIFPEVYSFKKLVTESKIEYKNNLLMFLDLHGHSTKKNVFAYGPEFPITDKFYYESKIFAKLLQKENKMFRYHSCIFRVSMCKISTARAILLKKINIPLSYTIEASNGFYHDANRLISVPFVCQDWKKMGDGIGKAVHAYIESIINVEKLKEERQKTKSLSTKLRSERLNQNMSQSSQTSAKNKNSQLTKREREGIRIDLKDDLKIKKIYAEILRQESEEIPKQEQQSDDNISEGSSDKEDQKSDLSQRQLQTLFTSIKHNNKLGKNKSKQLTQKFDLEVLLEQSGQDREFQDEGHPSKSEKSGTSRLQPIKVAQTLEPLELVFISSKNAASYFPKRTIEVRKYNNSFEKRQKVHQEKNTKARDNSKNNPTVKAVNYEFKEHDEDKSLLNGMLDTVNFFPEFRKHKNYMQVFEGKLDNSLHSGAIGGYGGEAISQRNREKSQSNKSILVFNSGTGVSLTPRKRIQPTLLDDKGDFNRTGVNFRVNLPKSSCHSDVGTRNRSVGRNSIKNLNSHQKLENSFLKILSKTKINKKTLL